MTAVGLVGLSHAGFAKAPPRPDIVVVGDSQISFGSGPALMSFFKNFETRCGGDGLPKAAVSAVAKMTVGMVGARSTGLHTWLIRSGREKRMLCVRDPAPNSLVNASVWGDLRRGSKWVQIGESRHHRYCRKGRSGIDLLLQAGAEPPRLLVLHMLARTAFRWSSVERATADMRDLESLLPAQTACVYLTTAPAYRRKINAPRVKAQANLKRAIKASGSRCQLVSALNELTLGAFQGNAKFYYRWRNGRVKDPFHPTPAAAAAFLDMNRAAFCKAIVTSLNAIVD